MKDLNLIKKSFEKVRVIKRFSGVFKGINKELEINPENSTELKENSYLDVFKASDYNAEKVLKEFREAVVKEKFPEKKFLVFFQFCGKIAVFSKLFKEVFSIFSEDIEGINEGLNLFKKLRDSEENLKNLSEKCKKLEKDLQKSIEVEQQNCQELLKVIDENKIMRNTCKNQSLVLNSLKNAGYPVEEFFNQLRSKKKSKSFTHFTQPTKPKLSINPINPLPQLNFTKTSAFKSYQEEFMSKFPEFSQSWRQEMEKAHPYLKP